MIDQNKDVQKVEMEQFVAFKLDQEEYAVPILEVKEVVTASEITPVPDAQAFILGLINLRGKIIPVVDLEKKFQLERENHSPRLHIIIAESEQKTFFGILVDQVSEVLKVPKDTIKPQPSILKSRISAEYVTGVVVITGTGKAREKERMLLVLNLAKILSNDQVVTPVTQEGGSKPARARRVKQIEPPLI